MRRLLLSSSYFAMSLCWVYYSLQPSHSSRDMRRDRGASRTQALSSRTPPQAAARRDRTALTCSKHPRRPKIHRDKPILFAISAMISGMANEEFHFNAVTKDPHKSIRHDPCGSRNRDDLEKGLGVVTACQLPIGVPGNDAMTSGSQPT